MRTDDAIPVATAWARYWIDLRALRNQLANATRKEPRVSKPTKEAAMSKRYEHGTGWAWAFPADNGAMLVCDWAEPTKAALRGATLTGTSRRKPSTDAVAVRVRITPIHAGKRRVKR